MMKVLKVGIVYDRYHKNIVAATLDMYDKEITVNRFVSIDKMKRYFSMYFNEGYKIYVNLDCWDDVGWEKEISEYVCEFKTHIPKVRGVSKLSSESKAIYWMMQ